MTGGLTSEAARYLDRLGLPPDARRQLVDALVAAGPRDPAGQMTRLHRLLADLAPQPGPQPPEHEPDDVAAASLATRLALTCGGTEAPPVLGADRHGHARLSAAPRIVRTPMAPYHWPHGRPARRGARRTSDGSAATPAPAGGPDARVEAAAALPPRPAKGDWHAAGSLRRMTLLALIILQTWLATNAMAAVLPYHGAPPLELAILALFAILFAWVSAGFWTALTGFGLLVAGRDRYRITRHLRDLPAIDPAARTAIVMPICNENVARVFAGLRATYVSLAQTGQLRHFDFFVLSDTSNPDTRVAELEAWRELCCSVGGFGRIFYRRRRIRIKRKSGNVADFCRRWGARYRYMVVLDADSVMSGSCLARLVQLMEANPGAGIIQTAPSSSGRGTLYARMQQFASRVYGPLFTAGLHFWQLGESHYWGHNAIIRVAPFTEYCALGRLPGSGALSGEILSHDFVEAALMRRAGWAVWIAYDLPGSYEEMPPNLNDELKRDRRWCQGNLMNLRLFLARGLHPAHRAVFVTGVMAYVSAPLWFLFLALSTALLAQHALIPPKYFTEPNQLFPLWPQSRPEWVAALILSTAGLLFLPKILSVVLIVAKGGAREFGGGLRLAASALTESVFSALLAPIRMMFHTRYVLGALLGWSSGWKSPGREDAETGWLESLRVHGWNAAFGTAWAAFVWWLNPSYLGWLLPVVGALALSIVVDVLSSRVSLGMKARARGLFVIPEERDPPPELEQAHGWAEQADAPRELVDAVIDPRLNAVVCAAGTVRERPGDGGVTARDREQLMQRALAEGPAALSRRERETLLDDPITLSRLHFRIWSGRPQHRGWRDADRDAPRAVSPARPATGGPWPTLQPLPSPPKA